MGVARSRGQQTGHIGVLDHRHARPAHVEADVGHLDASRQQDAVSLHQSGLERGERDGQVGPQGLSARLAGVAVHTRGDVDGQDPYPGGDRRGAVGAPEPRPVGGVDDQVDDADRPDAIGSVSGVDDRDPGAPSAQPGRGDSPVGTVVAFAGHDDHMATVGTTEHAYRPGGHGRPGPLDEGLLGDRPQRLGVDGAHLVDAQYRPHGVPSATTVATAMVSVWVSDTCHRATPRSTLKAAARPDNDSPGSPLSARTTSTSRNPAAPTPTPSAFSTASLAAKRTASRGPGSRLRCA